MTLAHERSVLHAPVLFRGGRVLRISGLGLVVAAAALLLVHLLGARPDARLDGSQHPLGFTPTATALEATLEGSAHAVSFEAGEHDPGTDASLESGGHHHSENSCAHLVPGSNAVPLAPPRQAWGGAVRPATASPTRDVMLSFGERSPPDLVRELQVIRV